MGYPQGHPPLPPPPLSVQFLNQFSCLFGFHVEIQKAYVQREQQGQTQENVLGATILGKR